jgi:hypothetical protein
MSPRRSLATQPPGRGDANLNRRLAFVPDQSIRGILAMVVDVLKSQQDQIDSLVKMVAGDADES